ncbi:MAG: sugar transferase [Actinobacteria bacterium]|nr:MAG: sugar transferase [Actinomycetota bacterium]
MPETASLPKPAEAQSHDAGARQRRANARPAAPRPLVARRYGRRDWFLRRLLALSDALSLEAAMVLALALLGGRAGHPWSEQALWDTATLPVWVALFKMYGLYERDTKRLNHSTLDDLPALFHALLLGCLLTWSYFVLVAPGRIASSAVLAFGGLALAFVLAGRMLARASLLRLISPERVLLIGTGDTSGPFIELMRARARRFRPIGVVTTAESADGATALRRLGSLEDIADLPSLLVERRVGRVVVADVELERGMLLQLLRDCKTLAVKVSLLPATFSALGPAVEVDDLQGVTVLGVNPPVLSRSSWLLKRALDLVAAGLLSLLTLPLLAVLAVAIKLDSPGPVFFRQERIGQGGRRFRLLKLRTMVANAESQRNALLAHSRDPGWLHLEHDPRITRVGRLLRMASLDELPQLWNVLRGDMSLVGPRPLVAEEDSRVAEWARGRLDLTPGITGLWQVLGRTSIPFEEMVRLDYLYVTNWSLWGDVRLMIRTLPVVLRRSGAN